jgi:hypothetical protein
MKTVWLWRTGMYYEAGGSLQIFASKKLAEEAEDTWIQTRCSHWAKEHDEYKEKYGDAVQSPWDAPSELRGLADIEEYTDEWSDIQEVEVIGS